MPVNHGYFAKNAWPFTRDDSLAYLGPYCWLNLDDQTAVVINRLTGAWIAGTQEKIRVVASHIADGNNGNPPLKASLREKIKALGLPRQAPPTNRFDITLAVVFLGYGCNLHCQYCFVPKTHGRQSPYLAIRTAEFLGQLPAPLLVHFMGGEPLLHLAEMTRMMDALRYSRQGLSTTYSIQTNGLGLLDPGRLEYLEREQIHIGVSFDGPEGMSRGRYGRRARQLEAQVTKSIGVLGDRGYQCHIIVVLNRWNVTRLIELVDWCLLQGLKRMHFNPLISGETRNPESITPDEMAEALKGLFRYWVDHKLYRRLAIDNFIDIERNLMTCHRSYMCRKYPCGAGINQLAFDINGDIYPCDYLVGQQAFRMGNVTKNTVREMAKSPLMAELHKQMAPEKLTACGNCPWLSTCGHCLSNAFLSGGGVAGPQTSCLADAALIREILLERLRNKEYADHLSNCHVAAE